MSARSFNDQLRASNDLKQLAPLFRQAVEAAIAECNNNGLDAMVYEAYRSQELQAQYYARGRTVIPPTETVTNAPTNLQSWHGYGLAVDVISRKKGWSAGDKWFADVAAVFKRHDCKWGGDWKQRDLPHFQWHRCKASPSDEARKLVTTVGIPAVWQAVGAVASDTPVAPAVVGEVRIAVVTASALNLRGDPSTTKPAIRLLERGTELQVLEPQGSWFRVRVDGVTGFVHGDMIALRDHAAGARFLSFDAALRGTPLRARKPLPPAESGARQAVVSTWNRYGGLLEPLSGTIGIQPACGVAVLCVESGGAAFLKGKMVIRFEVHVFNRLWGRAHQDAFNRHFRFDANKQWLGHEISDGVAAFAPYHGKQDGEWRAFDLACTLDRHAAIQSISMGAPQIMGFNFGALGYDSPEEMFDRFNEDERFHILGLFDFIKGAGGTSAMVQALQQENYEAFATRYNGSGQAGVYGARIRAHVEAFESALQPA